ncbi:hypothetical protein NIES2109_04520 [Nostoc sp. HK-01]|uniref:Uncharacterized protein n=1 Tax=Nostoc cycadae WK-1 TaxID=1861711 RepID=A0A2H6LDW6_9NOSO|nr:hypothetical protein [Nostoc cycadae]BBD57685.1 hypothetical protein NIES2109_04520 [Nostoc sp. HK-01]GBE91417.1 hypothetical protein NCWK1_1141 [Nostoc cycadae WK-1]
MFHGIERELLNGESGLLAQYSQPPPESELLATQKHDIWELPPQLSTYCEPVPQQEIKQLSFFSQLKSFYLKAIANKKAKRVL